MSSRSSPKRSKSSTDPKSKRNKRCGHHEGDTSCNRSMANWDLHLECIIHRSCSEEHPCSSCTEFTTSQAKAIRKALAEQRKRDSGAHNLGDDVSLSKDPKVSKRAKTLHIQEIPKYQETTISSTPPRSPQKRPADTPSEPTDPKVTKLDTPTGFNMATLENFMREAISSSLTQATDKIRLDLEASALTRHESLKENFKSTIEEMSRRFIPQANTILARETSHTPNATITRYSNSPRESRIELSNPPLTEDLPSPTEESSSEDREEEQEAILSLNCSHRESDFSERSEIEEEEVEPHFFTTAEKTLHFVTTSENGVPSILVHERYNTISKLLNIELIEDTPIKSTSSFKPKELECKDQHPPTANLPDSAGVFAILYDSMVATRTLDKKNKGSTLPLYKPSSKICSLQDKWHGSQRPSSKLNNICTKNVVPDYPHKSIALDLSTLKDLDMSARDIIGTLSYIDHSQQSIQTIIANLEFNAKNLDNTQILLLALTDLIAIYMRSITKSTSFILSTLTILKRDSYLQFLLPGLSSSLDVFQQMRLAAISSSCLFGTREAELIKDAQLELEEQKRNKDLRDSSRSRPKSQGNSKDRKRSSSRGGQPRRRQRSPTPPPSHSGHSGHKRSNQPFRQGRGGKQPQRQNFRRGGRSSRGGKRGNKY